MKSIKQILQMGLCLGAALAVSQVHAQTHNWVNPNDGAFGDNGNWDIGVPGTAGTARFNLNGAYAVEIDNDIQIGGLQHMAGGIKYIGGNLLKVDSSPSFQGGEARIQNPGTEVSSTSSFLVTGASGPLVVVEDEADVFIMERLIIAGGGTGTTFTGTVEVEGDGSSLITGGSLDVGFHGQGNLFVRNGAEVTSQAGMTLSIASGSEGHATVSGNDALLTVANAFTIGSSGDATFEVSNGGLVDANSSRLAISAGTTATATVSGANSQWDTNSLLISSSGTATVNIENQGSVSADSGAVGAVNGQGTLNITNENSELRAASSITLGSSTSTGRGFLTLTDGGDLFVGDNFPSSNTSSNIYVSDSTFATFNARNNSVIDNAGEMYIGYTNGNSGQVTLDDSTLNMTGTIRVGFVGDGVMNVENGARVEIDGSVLVATNINSSGELNVDGVDSTVLGTNIWAGVRDLGTINITDGGYIKGVTGFVAGLGGVGAANVDGVDSRWDIRNLTIGSSASNGVGVAMATNGGRIYVGNDSAPVASMVVSDFGSNGTMNVVNGSSVIADDDFLLAFNADTTGEVNVTGAGSAINFDGAMYAGTLGEAALNISDGGLVKGTPTAFAYVGPDSTIALDNGDLDAGNQFIVEGAVLAEDNINFIIGNVSLLPRAAITVNPGAQLRFNGDVTDNAPADVDMQINGNGQIRFNAAYTGSTSFDGAGEVYFNSELSLAGIGERAHIGVEGNVILDAGNEWIVDIEGTNAFDAMTIDGELKLGGTMTLNPINGFQFAPGQQFIISKVGVALTGQIAGLNSGDMLTQVGSVGIFIDYAGNDGNDLVLYTELVLDVVLPDGFEVTRGTYVSGNNADLSTSNNQDVGISRSSTDVLSRTEFEVKSTSPTANPSFMEVRLEGSVFARTTVRQTIEVYNYNTDSYEQIDVRDATRFSDSTTIIELTGDLSRFVEPGSNGMLARVRYQSLRARQRFNSNTDLFNWAVAQ